MFSKITRRKLDAFLKKHSTKNEVLNIGSGNLQGHYRDIFPNQITVDLDRDRQPDIVADIHNLPFDNNSKSNILCTEVLEHVREPQKAIDELHRVLKIGGRLILTTRFIYPLHDVPNDYFRYTKYGLKKLFTNWSEVNITPESKSFTAIAILLQRICFQSKIRFGKPIKFVLFLIAEILCRLDSLIIKEYGDIKKHSIDSEILSTGYYVIAKK